MFQQLGSQTSLLVGAYLPSVLGALVILIVGWIAALIASAIVRGVLRRTTLENRMAAWMFGERAGRLPLEEYCASAVFWIVMLFVLVAFFEALHLTVVTGPLTALLQQLGTFAPRLLGTAVLLLLAGVLASLLRRGVSAALTAAGADARLGIEEGRPVAESLGEVVYWTVWLLFLPMVLSTLELTGLLQPVQTLLNEGLAFLPNILAAAVALVVGWFIAHLVRRIVTSLLTALGLDRLGARAGVSQALGATSLSKAVGTVVYVLILLPVVIAALNALDIEAVTRPASNMLNTLLAAVPSLFAAAILLVLSYFVGGVVADLVSQALATLGFDRALAKIGLAPRADGVTPGRQPSTVAGQVVLVAIMLFAAVEAAGLLGFTEVQAMIASFLTLAGHILLGLIVFAVGMYLADLAARAVRSSGGAHAGILAPAARAAIIVLTGAMALRQMGLANEIINMAFGLLVGAIAVAVAIAFGLGSRDVAGRQVETWVNRYTGGPQ